MSKLLGGATISPEALTTMRERGNRFVDLTGRVFGQLQVIHESGRDKRGKARWKCQCTCGTIKVISSDNLIRGVTKSCGCLQKKVAAKNARKRNTGSLKTHPHYKHGHSHAHSGTYISWLAMIGRCCNPNHEHFLFYGGANPPVLVCDRWRNSFESFLEDMGERPKGTTLGRFKDAGNYEPVNIK